MRKTRMQYKQVQLVRLPSYSHVYITQKPYLSKSKDTLLESDFGKS